MQWIFPSLPSVIKSVINMVKKDMGNIDRALTEEEFFKYIERTGFLNDYCKYLVYEEYYYPEDAAHEATLLGHHTYYILNFELHRRKIFWVEESLAWMFLQTQLDIEGECLKLPFPCCAFIFTDKYTLELAEKFLYKIDDCKIKGDSLDKASEGRIISKRFMVRGHWRKANPTWKDQSLRWIEP